VTSLNVAALSEIFEAKEFKLILSLHRSKKDFFFTSQEDFFFIQNVVLQVGMVVVSGLVLGTILA